MADAARVRDFALSLPKARERLCYGTPAFYVGRTLFARMLPEEDLVVVKIDQRERDRRLAADPQAYSATEHYVNHPMMIVRLSAIDDDELGELLKGAWEHATR